ncbi:hypothetical protein VB780_00460 [Leptolyngbya sp. CCNP1308]|uniref:hypothetical protein n=1 Tax=Leptolyngbya sp. CCNP1308 TaxID=3110255 RepID=UPI002B21A41F|nr:hypothetical protein [Leptolyngbya sp. CCNP1308]MEA5447021.1 hypothetical protein [Leptolyngbya sp. CCNP1308]
MAAQQNSEERQPISQPLTPEEVSPEQRAEMKRAMKENDLVLNPGDYVDGEKTLEEKSKQVAVDTADITGDRIVVPTYFVVDDTDGEQKALHHIKDAEEISDVIRQARVDEDGNRTWN